MTLAPDWEGMIRFAHAEIARLRAELAEARENEVFCNGCSGGEWTWMRRADEAEAAIARVRELCDDLHPLCKGGHVLDAVRDAATIERTKK